MTKYNVVMCYDKILVNVVAYVITYQDCIITAHYYIVFCRLMIHDFS